MLWWCCVKYRDKWCQICGWTPPEPELLEAHHVYFRSHGCWRVQFDTDFGVSLCHHEHQIAPYAPHQNNERFLDLIIPRIQQDSPERAARILNFLNNPIELCSEEPDYHKIAGRLRAELKIRKEHYEIDKYGHDEVYRGRKIGKKRELMAIAPAASGVR